MRLVHYSDRPIGSPRLTPRHILGFKPDGLWVSDDDDEMTWPAWCWQEQFRLHKLACAHAVALAAGARILHLSSARDIDSFTDAFSVDRHPGILWSRLFIDWDAVAARWQGIIISPYIWERRLGDGAEWYYAWDCASGCIWDLAAIESVNLCAPSLPLLMEKAQ